MVHDGGMRPLQPLRAWLAALLLAAPLLAQAAVMQLSVYPPQPTAADSILLRVFVPGDPRVNSHTVTAVGHNIAVTLVQDGADLGSPHAFVAWEQLGVLAAGDYDVYVRRVRPGGVDETQTLHVTVVAPATPGLVDAVEFYHAGLDHYFLSTDAAEIADLDAGRHPGWVRTGGSFKVFDGPADPTKPVCRFYIAPAFGDSHFFSANRDECTALALDAYDRAALGDPTLRYVFETGAAFYVRLPDVTTGLCPGGTQPVYRLWNGRADSGHRFTTNASTRADMVAMGYISEGYGPLGVAMCAPLR